MFYNFLTKETKKKKCIETESFNKFILFVVTRGRIYILLKK